MNINTKGMDLDKDNITIENKFDSSLDGYYKNLNQKEIFPLLISFIENNSNNISNINDEYFNKLFGKILYDLNDLLSDIKNNVVYNLDTYLNWYEQFEKKYNYKYLSSLLVEYIEPTSEQYKGKENEELYFSLGNLLNDIFNLISKILNIYEKKVGLLNQEINKVYVQIEEEVDKQNDLAELDDLLDDAYG